MKIIYGPKGTGKTQKAVDRANITVKTAKGNVLFVSDTDKNMYDLDHGVKFIDTSKFNVQSQDAFRGFLTGLVAANADNELIFIDSITGITDLGLADLEETFNTMVWLEKNYGIEFVLTVSGKKAELPKFVSIYA